MKFLRTSDLFREVKIYQGKQSVDSRGTFLKPFFGSELVGLFDSISESKRHKSGIAVRFPRMKRIRFDKTLNDIDRLSSLKKLI